MIELDVKYKAGHSYHERWDRDESMFCPHCGKKSLWTNAGAGDYYVGPESICTSCGDCSYLENCGPCFSKHEHDQRLTAIRLVL